MIIQTRLRIQQKTTVSRNYSHDHQTGLKLPKDVINERLK